MSGTSLILDWRADELDVSDAVLLDRLRNGDKQAFSALFLRYYQSVHNMLARTTGDSHEAEDLSQEVFVRLYRHPLDANRQHNLRAWLYRVALNLSLNARRAKQRESGRCERAHRLTEQQRHTDGDTEDSLLRGEEQERVRRALDLLAPRQRQCLILRYEGFTYAEIAQVLEVSPGSVGTLLARAEAEFTRCYKALGEEGVRE